MQRSLVFFCVRLFSNVMFVCFASALRLLWICIPYFFSGGRQQILNIAGVKKTFRVIFPSGPGGALVRAGPELSSAEATVLQVGTVFESVEERVVYHGQTAIRRVRLVSQLSQASSLD